MNKKQRLNLYEEALKDYQTPYKRYLKFGFYRYFSKVHNLDLYHYFEKLLPELYKQWDGKKHGNFVFYMWPEGKKQPRIKALQEAIKLCQKR